MRFQKTIQCLWLGRRSIALPGRQNRKNHSRLQKLLQSYLQKRRFFSRFNEKKAKRRKQTTAVSEVWITVLRNGHHQSGHMALVLKGWVFVETHLRPSRTQQLAHSTTSWPQASALFWGWCGTLSILPWGCRHTLQRAWAMERAWLRACTPFGAPGCRSPLEPVNVGTFSW